MNGKKSLKYNTDADGIVIALGGLAGAHGRLLNPAVSIAMGLQLA